MDSARFAFTLSSRSLPPAGPAPRPPGADPVSRFCLVAPLLRRELDQLRGRRGTPAEQGGDRHRLDATSRRLAELLCVSFT